ncbi:unnamed protein product [Rotaria magnacalcarata]
MNNQPSKISTVFAYRSITIKCVFTSINSNNVISCQIVKNQTVQRCNLQLSNHNVCLHRSTAIMLYSFDLLVPVFFVLDFLLCWHHASV